MILIKNTIFQPKTSISCLKCTKTAFFLPGKAGDLSDIGHGRLWAHSDDMLVWTSLSTACKARQPGAKCRKHKCTGPGRCGAPRPTAGTVRALPAARPIGSSCSARTWPGSGYGYLRILRPGVVVLAPSSWREPWLLRKRQA